jgi:hypothetical protein
MHYVGIDIGKRYHYASVLTDTTLPTKPVRFNTVRDGYTLFLAYLAQHNCQQTDTIIGLEATGHYWLTLFEKLKRDGYTVYVLNPLQVDSYRNENIRGAKTDEIDCQLIAKIIRFGSGKSTNLPKEELFVLRELCRFRADIRKRTTTLKLKILAILDQVFPEYQSVFPDIFCKTAQELLKEYQTAEMIAEEDLEKLTKVYKRTSGAVARYNGSGYNIIPVILLENQRLIVTLALSVVHDTLLPLSAACQRKELRDSLVLFRFPGRVARTPPVWRSAVCSPLLSPFGLESVTVFDPGAGRSHLQFPTITIGCCIGRGPNTRSG